MPNPLTDGHLISFLVQLNTTRQSSEGALCLRLSEPCNNFKCLEDQFRQSQQQITHTHTRADTQSTHALSRAKSGHTRDPGHRTRAHTHTHAGTRGHSNRAHPHPRMHTHTHAHT